MNCMFLSHVHIRIFFDCVNYVSNWKQYKDKCYVFGVKYDHQKIITGCLNYVYISSRSISLLNIQTRTVYRIPYIPCITFTIMFEKNIHSIIHAKYIREKKNERNNHKKRSHITIRPLEFLCWAYICCLECLLMFLVLPFI